MRTSGVMEISDVRPMDQRVGVEPKRKKWRRQEENKEGDGERHGKDAGPRARTAICRYHAPSLDLPARFAGLPAVGSGGPLDKGRPHSGTERVPLPSVKPSRPTSVPTTRAWSSTAGGTAPSQSFAPR